MAISTGVLSKKNISAISLLDSREILDSILDVTNEGSSFMDIMELTGRSVETAQPVYSQFINDELYVVGTVATVTGTGTQVTLTMDATSAAAIIPGEQGYVPDGSANFVVVSKTGNDIVIKAVDGTTALNTKIAATNKLAFFGNAQGEGSSQPTAKKWGATSYDNQVQIFKNTYNITDIQDASTLEVEIDGEPLAINKLAMESLAKFRGDIAFTMFLGQKSAANFGSQSPSLTDAAGNPIQTTMGFDQYARTYGVNDTLAAPTAVTLADLKRLNATLNTNRSPLDYLMFTGTTMNVMYDDLLNALGNSNALSNAARFTIDGRSIELGIDDFKIYGRSYHKKYLPLLDHKNVVNFTGAANYKDSAYFVPTGKVKTIDGQMVDIFRTRFMKSKGYDGRYNEIHLGGLAPTPTDGRSVHEVVFSSIQGLEILGAQHLVKQKTA